MTHTNLNKITGKLRTPKSLEGRLQIFEMKQLADMEADYKIKCREALDQYKKWQADYADETDMIELMYGNLEGIMHRRRAEDSVRAYWIIRQDFRKLFSDYLAQTKAYPAQFGALQAA